MPDDSEEEYIPDDHDDVTDPLLNRTPSHVLSRDGAITTWRRIFTSAYWWKFKVVTVSTFVALALQLLWSWMHSDHPTTSVILPSYDMPGHIAHRLGGYGPRYPVKNFGTYGSISYNIPTGCSVVLVSTLQRHGARNPTTKDLDIIIRALHKLKVMMAHHPTTDPALAFLKTYDVRLGAESLVPFGKKQSFLSGRRVATTYPNLASEGVFIRSTTKDRVAESSRWFRQGFEDRPFNVKKNRLIEPDLLMAIGPHTNNTLSVKPCHDVGSQKQELQWLSIYGPPIAERINNAFSQSLDDAHEDVRLNEIDIVQLMSLCGIETALRDGAKSPWCDVFTKDEWEANEYFYDLMKYYKYGPGSLVSRSQGSGWVNELVARLTGTAVRYAGAINTTLDSNPVTFPIPPNSPKIFADFSSDNDIIRILSTLGILQQEDKLNPLGPPSKDRLFNIAKIVPFAGALVIEKLSCSKHPHSTPQRARRTTDEVIGNSEYVRIVLNDGVVPLTWKQCGDLGLRKGLCELDRFLEMQKYALRGGEWEKWCETEGDGDDNEEFTSFSVDDMKSDY